jgi:phospholipid/cholesterol/gamma-HCH transport system substrate-binding protein
MARRSAAELATGAVVIVLALGFLGYAVVHTGQRLSGGYTLHASFDHVDGLSVGSDVRIAGVKVGSVEAIAFDPKTFLADVGFSVQDDVRLSTDSSATVASDGLLGGKYLQLSPGGEEKMLGPGGTITITQGSVNLEALIGKYIFGSTGGGGKPGGSAQGQGGSGQGGGGQSGGGLAPLK